VPHTTQSTTFSPYPSLSNGLSNFDIINKSVEMWEVMYSHPYQM
jgi:hypothetical protein